MSNGFTFSERSENNLRGVHPDLVAVTRRALELTAYDFTVIEGLRSRERQAELVADGKSRTMNSRHLTGHAVDFMVWKARGVHTWDFSYYREVSKAFKTAAEELSVGIVWGGDWTSFKDGPHVELERNAYPADGDMTSKRPPRKITETSTGKTGIAGIVGTAGAGIAAAADNAPAVLEHATNPAMRGIVDALPWAGGLLAAVAVAAVILLLVRKAKMEREA